MEFTEILGGWGNYKRRRCKTHYPAGNLELHRWLEHNQGSFISRGLGRSYGDSAVNSTGYVLHHYHRNRFLSFDETSGYLTCEAGVSLAEIIDVLLKRGWFLPTTPGTKFVTVGGAIAADVHGKNHHVDGSFGNYVHRIELLLPSGQVRTCSRNQNETLFRATVGGMGLTGIILQATLQLKPVQSAWVTVDYKRTKDLNDTFFVLSEDMARYRYSVAWMDCVSRGRPMGRSVCMVGRDAAPGELPRHSRRAPLRLPPKRAKTVPFDFPRWALSRPAVEMFNRIYFSRNSRGTRWVDYDSFFYPLDSILEWNRIHGKRGFVQYQAFLPPDTAENGYERILERIIDSGIPPSLTVFKSCGTGRNGLLSFLDEGYTLALDLPNEGRALCQLASALDQILIHHGGRLYMAKDALTDKDAFAVMYPNVAEFRAIKAEVDPQQQIVSDQARRLGIVE